MATIEEIHKEEARQIYPMLPLSASKPQIRLLSIDLNLTDDDDVKPGYPSGNLHVVSLETPPPYTALSYVWGDEIVNRRPIRLNGVWTTITDNLAIALDHFRREVHGIGEREGKGEQHQQQYFWIDALCINQTDTDEKDAQVLLMGRIYASATRTFLWLGPSYEDSDLAMGLVRTISQQTFDDYDPHDPAWRALSKLFERVWWTRMWVVQEAMLSRSPIVKCGGQQVDFDNFTQMKALHEANSVTQMERFVPLRRLFGDAPFRSLLWRNWRDWVNKPLSVWLIDTRDFQCSWLRDRAYALLGLVQESSRKQIEVKYDKVLKSDRDVMIDVAMLLYHEEGLLFLQISQDQKERRDTRFEPELPSWCPDWTKGTPLVTLVGPSFAFCACSVENKEALRNLVVAQDLSERGGMSATTPTFSFSEDREVLSVRGFILGNIDFADPTPEVPIYKGDDAEAAADSKKLRAEETMKACLKWEKHVRDHKRDAYKNTPINNGGNSFEEAFCRTVIVNRYYFGAEVDSRKVTRITGSDVKPKFDAWVGRGWPDHLTTDSASETRKTKFVQSYSYSAIIMCAGRAFITTGNGLFGLAPSNTQRGDVVCLLYSGEVAYILRPAAGTRELKEGEQPLWTFVGEAYVHGFMQGEFLRHGIEETSVVFRIK